MGRRKDPAALQAAKGFPGKRKGRVHKEIAAAAAAAEAASEAAAEPFAVPKLFLADPDYYRRAIDLWGVQSRVLQASGRRRPGYVGALTRYCLYLQYWEEAAEEIRRDIPDGGRTVKWRMGHMAEGEAKVIVHPAAKFQIESESALRLLEAEFGFTPRADHDLTRVESFNAAQMNLPLGGRAPANLRPAGPEMPDGDPMDLMNETDSAPPGARPN